MMTDEDSHAKALAAARRAVQFLESGQATGAFIVLTDDDRAIMWDSFISPNALPIGDAALVLTEAGTRLRRAWWELIAATSDGGSFLAAVVEDDEDEQ